MTKTTLFLCSILLSVPAFASGEAPHQMPPEMMKQMTPGEAHQKLKDLEGSWTYKMKMWETPEAKAQEMAGKSKSKLILGGRFLQEDVKAKMGKMNFEGISLTGFDNMRGEYQSIWIDNMSTGMMVSSGKAEDGAVKQSGTFSCPMTNEKERSFRSEMMVKDKNSHTYAMYSKLDGKEYKMMEIEYTRAK
jgi:hypothetical protein